MANDLKEDDMKEQVWITNKKTTEEAQVEEGPAPLMDSSVTPGRIRLRHLRPVDGLAEPLLDQFRTEIGVQDFPLSKTRRTSRRPAVLKAFVLHELLQDEPQWAVCERLLKELPVGAC